MPLLIDRPGPYVPSDGTGAENQNREGQAGGRSSSTSVYIQCRSAQSAAAFNPLSSTDGKQGDHFLKIVALILSSSPARIRWILPRCR